MVAKMSEAALGALDKQLDQLHQEEIVRKQLRNTIVITKIQEEWKEKEWRRQEERKKKETEIREEAREAKLAADRVAAKLLFDTLQAETAEVNKKWRQQRFQDGKRCPICQHPERKKLPPEAPPQINRPGVFLQEEMKIQLN